MGVWSSTDAKGVVATNLPADGAIPLRCEAFKRYPPYEQNDELTA